MSAPKKKNSIKTTSTRASRSAPVSAPGRPNRMNHNERRADEGSAPISARRRPRPHQPQRATSHQGPHRSPRRRHPERQRHEPQRTASDQGSAPISAPSSSPSPTTTNGEPSRSAPVSAPAAARTSTLMQPQRTASDQGLLATDARGINLSNHNERRAIKVRTGLRAGGVPNVNAMNHNEQRATQRQSPGLRRRWPSRIANHNEWRADQGPHRPRCRWRHPPEPQRTAAIKAYRWCV